MRVYNEIKMLEVRDVKPYFNNPRKNDKSVAALVKIIPDVGFNVPLLVDKNHIIIKGHSRFNAAKILKMDEIPCIISHATDEQNNADRVVDNAINDLSMWDDEKLAIELREIETNYKDIFNFNDSYSKGVLDMDFNVKPDDFNYSKETKKGESLLNMNCPACGHGFKLSSREMEKKIKIDKKLKENKKKKE